MNYLKCKNCGNESVTVMSPANIGGTTYALGIVNSSNGVAEFVPDKIFEVNILCCQTCGILTFYDAKKTNIYNET